MLIRPRGTPVSVQAPALNMDESRLHDMAKLTAVLNDPAEPSRRKRMARRAIERIKQKVHDPYLKKHRERLIKASRAGDADEVEKISDLIHDYSMRTYGRV